MVGLCARGPLRGAVWWACVPVSLLEEEVHYVSSYAYTTPEERPVYIQHFCTQ